MLTPPEKKRPTQNVFGPDCSSMSATPLLKPLTIAPITMTTITPIATPRIVSAARALWARSDSSAMPTPSSSGVTGSLLAQGGDGVEAGGAARGVHAGDHAHAAAHDHPEDDRERGDGGRERADRIENAAQLVPEVQHAFRRFHREVVVLPRAQVPPAAHDGFGLVHRFPHLGLGVGLHD